MAKAAAPTSSPALHEKSTDGERALLLSVILLGSMYIVVRPAANQFLPYSIEASFAALIAILFAFSSAFRVLFSKPALLIPPAITVVGVLWSGVFLWGALRSPNMGVGIPQACDAVIYMLMLLSGFFVARREPVLIPLFTRAIIAMVVVEACLAIWQRYVDLPFLQAQVRSGNEFLPAVLQSNAGLSRLYGLDVFGSFGNPNSLAAYLIVGIWLTAGHFSAAAGERKRMLPALLFIAVMLLALVLTNSKGGIVALIAGGWLFMLQKTSSRPQLQRALKWLTVAGILLGLFIVVLAFLGKVPVPFSLAVRLDYWRAALGMIAQHPLDGVGMAGFAENYSLFKVPLGTETKEAHNDYLHLWAELGILGPLIYGATWFMLLRGSARAVAAPKADVLSDSRQIERVVLGAGVLAFVFMYLGFQPFNSAEIFRLIFGEANSHSVMNALLALALPAVFVCVMSALRSRGESAPVGSGGLQHGFNAAAGALLVHQFVDFDFKAQAVIGSMFLLGGMYYGLRHTGENDSASASKLSLAAKLVPMVAGVLLLPFAVWFPMSSGGHRAQAELLEEDAARMLREKPPEGNDLEADKKYRGLRRDIAEARLNAARAAPFDGNAWLDLAGALQTMQREYHSISREKEIAAAIDQGERLRPLAAYPKVMRGDLYFYDGMHRVQRDSPGELSFEKALEAYSAAEARYPLAPGFPLLKGDVLLMLGRTGDAAAEYLRAFKIDIHIYDGNVRLNSAFTDPRPGVLPRHGFERKISSEIQKRLKTLPPAEQAETRRGLMLRRAVSLAALLQESRRTSAIKPQTVIALEREMNAALQIFFDATQEMQERAHAALLLALSFRLAPSLPLAERDQAWEQAFKLQQESVRAGRPGTPTVLFDFFYANRAPK